MYSTLSSLLNFKTQEEAPYTVLGMQGPFEIRLYQRFVCARMSLSGPYEEIIRIGNKYLQEYLEGNNFKVEKIDDSGCSFQIMKDKSWELGIILPSSFSIYNTPKPINRMIRISEVAPAKMGSLSFKGQLSRELFIRRGEELKRWLDFKNLHGRGPLRVMKVNSSLPFIRNYEVQFELFS